MKYICEPTNWTKVADVRTRVRRTGQKVRTTRNFSLILFNRDLLPSALLPKWTFSKRKYSTLWPRWPFSFFFSLPGIFVLRKWYSLSSIGSQRRAPCVIPNISPRWTQKRRLRFFFTPVFEKEESGEVVEVHIPSCGLVETRPKLTSLCLLRADETRWEPDCCVSWRTKPRRTPKVVCTVFVAEYPTIFSFIFI